MTLQEIKDHFGDNIIYKFNGTRDELYALMMDNSTGYNYIMVNDEIYFTSLVKVDDVKIEIIT